MRTIFRLVAWLCLPCSFLGGCASSMPPSTTEEPPAQIPDIPTELPPTEDPPVETITPPRQVSFAVIHDSSDIGLSELAAQSFDMIMIEPSRNGDLSTELTLGEVETLRSSGACPKQILAYLHLARAEDSATYWDPVWVTGDGITGFPLPGLAPAWLGEWDYMIPATYQVRYWDPQWHAVIMGTTAAGSAATPFDRIINAQYDGVYLDGVAAYDFWSSGAQQELTRSEARERMVAWVVTLTEYARQVRGLPDFKVFVQNGNEIIFDDRGQLDGLGEQFLDVIDGIAVEHVFFNEDVPKLQAQVAETLSTLAAYTTQGKTVLVIDYVIRTTGSKERSDQLLTDLYQKASASGLSPYAAASEGDLANVLILDADEWSVAQPPPCGP